MGTYQQTMLNLLKTKENTIVEEETIQEVEAEQKHHKHLAEENQSSCQICGKVGHIAFNCWHRFKEDYEPQSNEKNQSQATTNVAKIDSENDQGWYLDNGATNHVTYQIENLETKYEYKGSDKLMVGNGHKLKINYIGRSSLPVPYQKPIILKDILHVPHITKNLLSISKLLYNNDLFFFSRKILALYRTR